MQVVPVAAVALIDGGDRVLMAERPAGKSFAGQWEFPGGKIEAGETPEAALVREIAEELGLKITAESLQPISFASHAYGDFHLLLLLFGCRQWAGTAVGREGQALHWDHVDRLADLPMPPADIPLLAALAGWLAVPSHRHVLPLDDSPAIGGPFNNRGRFG